MEGLDRESSEMRKSFANLVFACLYTNIFLDVQDDGSET